MSKKQDFMRDYIVATNISQRKYNWLTKADLMEVIRDLQAVIGQSDWILYQLLRSGDLSHKNFVKVYRHLSVQGYDLKGAEDNGL